MTFACLLHHHIRFSGADDGLFTDELLSFKSNDIDPLFQGTTDISYLSDPTLNLDLGSNSNFDSSNIFASDINYDPDSTIDPTNFDIADCGGPSMNNGVLRKNKQRKTRIRRQTETSCGSNLYSPNNSPPLPNLSLPSLQQLPPLLNQAGKEDDPLRKATPEERMRADRYNVLMMLGEGYFHLGPQKACTFDTHQICTAGGPSNVKLEQNEVSYSVRGTESKAITSIIHSAQPPFPFIQTL